MAQDPAVTDEGTRNYDALFASGTPERVTDEVVITAGENFSRGTVLAIDAVSGEFAPYDGGNADRDEVVAVAAEDVDTTGGSSEEAVVYRSGTFAEEKVSITGATVADIREEAAQLEIFFQSIYEK